MRHSAGAWSGKTSEVPKHRRPNIRPSRHRGSSGSNARSDSPHHADQARQDPLVASRTYRQPKNPGSQKTGHPGFLLSGGSASGNCIPFQTRIPGHTFRKQRRPLNVASVLRRTVRAGNLICLRPDRRFSYELAASRYLILVVPGAKLGSVSLASVWKCSV